MTENFEGKTILLGNDEILTIDKVEERMFRCFKLHKETDSKISDILVPRYSCQNTDNKRADLESVPSVNKVDTTNVSFENVEALPVNTDFTDYNVYVRIKGGSQEFKVVKTTKKAVHYIAEDGEKKYASFPNVKKIVNYNPGQTLPEITGKSTKDLAQPENLGNSGKKKGKKKENPADYAEAKGRDGKATGGAKKSDQKKQATTGGKKTTKKTKTTTETSTPAPAPVTANDGNKNYLSEIPAEADFRKDGRNVFIDIPNKGEGLKIKYIRNGRIFWVNLESGAYSAVSMKKVEKDGLKLYEVKQRNYK